MKHDPTQYSDKQEIVYIKGDYKIIHRLRDGDKDVHPNLAPYSIVKGDIHTGMHIDDAGDEADARERLHSHMDGNHRTIINKRWRNKLAPNLVCPQCTTNSLIGTEGVPGSEIGFRCQACSLKFVITNPAVLK